MIPYTQKILHNPEAGVKGDCFRTVLGCLLHVEPTGIPLFHDATWRKDVQRWLKAYGKALMYVPTTADTYLPWEQDASQVYHAIAGPSPRDPAILHAVVGLDGRAIHDPHPSREGLAGAPADWSYILLVSI